MRDFKMPTCATHRDILLRAYSTVIVTDVEDVVVAGLLRATHT